MLGAGSLCLSFLLSFRFGVLHTLPSAFSTYPVTFRCKMAKLSGQLVREISEAQPSVSGKAQGNRISGPFDGGVCDSGTTGRCRRVGGVTPWKKNITGTISCPELSSLSCSAFSRLPWCALLQTLPQQKWFFCS